MVPLGVGAHFERWGYDMQRVQEVDWYDGLALSPTLQLTATPARHFSGAPSPRTSRCGWG